MTPVRSIATTEPMPRLSSSSPSTPSSTPSRVFANGTSGAQHAMPKPATRKASRVARRVAGRSAEDMGTPGKQGGAIDKPGIAAPLCPRRARIVADSAQERRDVNLGSERVAFGTIFVITFRRPRP